MVPSALAAFVAGAWLLQQQAVLPGTAVLAATTCAAIAALSQCLLWGARLHASALATANPGWHLAVVLVGVSLGACHAAWFATARLADELTFENEGRDVRVTGIIASLPAQLPRGKRFEFDVEATETPNIHVPARISLGWFGASTEVRPGERWRFTVRLRRPHGALNPGGFDLEAWLLERNLRATGYVRDGNDAPERLRPMIWRIGYMIDRARHVLRERLQQRLDGQRHGGVLIALVLGDQRAIGEDDWLLFNRTGIAHLVSISGLHITMIAGLFALAAGRLWRRSGRALALAPAQSASALAAMLAAWAYCLLAGWGVPAQRTFFMLTTVAAAMLVRLGTRPATTLVLAAAVVTALDPWAVLAPGFWLSFGAVAAIFFALHGRPARPAHSWRAVVFEASRVQMVVTVALVPLTVVLFQQVSLVSPFANAVAIPVVSLLVTPLALAAACFVMLPEPFATVAVPLLAFAHTLMLLLGELLQWVVQWRFVSIALPAPPPWAACVAVLGVAWLLAPPAWPARWAGAVWLLPLFLWPAERPRAGELWLTALDVGQGAALVVETPAHVLVYDAGPRYSPQADAGSRIVLPYLRARGIDRIDLLVVSHLDSDHSGGAASILKGVDVATALTSVDAAHPMLGNAKSVRRCLAGDRTVMGTVEIGILHPTETDYALPARNTNARSCVLQLDAGGTRLLLSGDLPAQQEFGLLAREPDLHATLLTAPHHGSRRSSTEPFVRAVAPTWVVAQVGYRNRFGHPDPIVIARYRSVGSTVIRSDVSGATQWRFAADGSVAVVQQRRDAARYWHNQPGRERPAGEVAADDASSADATTGSEAAGTEILSPRD